MKGVVTDERGVLLAFNDRDEWELPGGRLEDGETPQECVAREIREECSLAVTVSNLLDAWVFEVIPGRHVLILAYLCNLEISSPAQPQTSPEHSEVRFVGLAELDGIALPLRYRNAIELARR